ncbi:MAG: F0F1 ATP synthase subunit B [Parasphingopyxis sp.]|nr:F0F1 ATP synthase subunit B [Sphingomonadales bacterium]
MANAPLEELDAIDGESAGEDPAAATQAHTAEDAYAAPTALGLDTTGWVAVSMLIVIGIMIWKKVPQLIAGALDKRIAEIRHELDEAAKLRAEAEALKAEYEAKTANADKEAAALLERAGHEADEILAEAEEKADALIRRRRRLAENKIAAAERSAVAEVRARAATAATAAAARLIEQKHGSDADKALVDRTIAGLDARVS